MGADEEARWHIVALAQGLYNFGHRTKDYEMELWHRLGNTVDLPKVERQVAGNQEIMANKYDQFVQKLPDFINQEFRQFGKRLMLLEGNAQKYKILEPRHVRSPRP